MIDSHCHLDFPAFDHDRAKVLARCEENGVEGILIPGTEASRWERQIHICSEHPALYLALGIHPYFLHNFKAEHLDDLSARLGDCVTDVVAVGEIGLDFSLDTDPVFQTDVFEAQLDLAKQHELPVIVHHRRSHNALLRIIKKSGLPRGGVVHAFSGSKEEAFQYLDSGFLLGAGGTLTYERARKTRKAFIEIPEWAFLLETDAPDMPMSGRQGQRNSPEFIVDVASALAQLRRCSLSEIAAQATENFTRLFGVHKTDNTAI